MNNKIISEKDELRDFLSDTDSTKAPEGLSDKIMNIIETESVKSLTLKDFIFKNKVPIVSVTTTILLMILVAIFNGTEPIKEFTPVTLFFQNLNTVFGELSLDIDFQISLPDWTIYVFTVMIILAIFDRGLNSFFRKTEKES